MTDSAAARTFQVTEILESILLMVPLRGCQRRNRNARSRAGPAVVEQLFALQRVDRTFAATIQGSKKIRQKMLLEPYEVTDNTDSQRALRPLKWFLDYIGLRSGIYCCDHESANTFALSEDFSEDILRTAEKHLSCSTDAVSQVGECASWRQIGLREFSPESPIKLGVPFLFAQNHMGHAMSGYWVEVYVGERVSHAVESGSVVTLGELWTKICNTVRQDRLGHQLSSGSWMVVGDGAAVWETNERGEMCC